jgi:hypothetical protein
MREHKSAKALAHSRADCFDEKGSPELRPDCPKSSDLWVDNTP